MAGNDEYTKLLLHLNGADESTTIIDSSSSAKSPSSVAGNAQLDTADQEFGSASLVLDGDGDTVIYANDSDFSIGTGDFTIDTWVKLDRLVVPYSAVIACNGTKDSAWRWLFEVRANGYIRFAAGTGTWGSATYYLATDNPVTYNGTTWHHVAVARSGNTIYLFVDGVLCTGYSTTINDFNNVDDETFIGSYYNKAGEGYFDGHIDEFRFSKGIARWTDDFDVPTEEYNGAVGTNMQMDFGVWKEISLMKVDIGGWKDVVGMQIDLGGWKTVY